MEELEFPLDLQCSCLQVFLEGEEVFFNRLDRKDVASKIASAKKMKTFSEFLDLYEVDPSRDLDAAVVEEIVSNYEIKLAKRYLDHSKQAKMAAFYDLFESAKELIPMKGTSSKGLPPFTKVIQQSSLLSI